MRVPLSKETETADPLGDRATAGRMRRGDERYNHTKHDFSLHPFTISPFVWNARVTLASVPFSPLCPSALLSESSRLVDSSPKGGELYLV